MLNMFCQLPDTFQVKYLQISKNRYNCSSEKQHNKSILSLMFPDLRGTLSCIDCIFSQVTSWSHCFQCESTSPEKVSGG